MTKRKFSSMVKLLKPLRKSMCDQNLAAFIVPSADPHQSGGPSCVLVTISTPHSYGGTRICCGMLHTSIIHQWLHWIRWNCCDHRNRSAPVDRWPIFSTGISEVTVKSKSYTVLSVFFIRLNKNLTRIAGAS